MRIYFGCDHAGIELKDALCAYVADKGYDVVNYGCDIGEKGDYPKKAYEVCKDLVKDNDAKAVLICGTGVGMSMSANKVKGIRAVVCSEPYSAKLSIEHNDANVLCMGQRVVGIELAKMILDTWLSSEFAGGRHANRVNMIMDIENK